MNKIREWLILKVRDYLRDHPELNNLIEGEETGSRLISQCMDRVVEDFNSSPPPIRRYKLEQFPSVSLLLDGTICHILRSKAIQFSRNSLQYSDGGINVSDQEKSREYLAIAEIFCRQYSESRDRLKIAKNISIALGDSGGDPGGVPSEYSFICDSELSDEYNERSNS